jgi:trans-o-hydroxybenzylidenepyruvate hydratase-aldolase
MIAKNDIRGVYAIIPTPAKSGSDRLDATRTVDLDETARVTEQLIKDGVSGLIALGTTGECATLSHEDYESFVDCVLATVRRRVPCFIGTSALGTHEIVHRIRFVRDRGGNGTLLGLPQWQPCTTDMAVRFYEGISEAFPDFAVMVYANQRAFRFDFNATFWAQIARRAPTATSSKFSNSRRLLEVQNASEGKIHFLPHENSVYQFMQLSPATTQACWATAASMGPEPALAIMKAILVGDGAKAAKINADLNWAIEPIMFVLEKPEEFAHYNIQIEKIRINEAGYCKGGPIRPPYQIIPDQYAEAARECGRRWAQLRPKYAAP